MEEVLTPEFLDAVKNNLDITWSDPGTDQKVSGWTRAGIHYLNARAGEAMEYCEGSDEWALLMDYVRYARDGALDVFEENYLHLLLAMQTERRMAREKNTISTGQ